MKYRYEDHVHIGFTGTRKGMSPGQRDNLLTILTGALKGRGHCGAVLHHGDCVGADAEAHEVARSLGMEVVIHPPTNPKARAFCDVVPGVMMPTLPYLERNRAIVNACSLLVAAPAGAEMVRSGTWATVRYARMKYTRILVLEREGVGVQYIGGPEQDEDERQGN